jgi:hypothetical protein
MAKNPQKALAHYLNTPPTREQTIAAIRNLIADHERQFHAPWYKRLWRRVARAVRR